MNFIEQNASFGSYNVSLNTNLLKCEAKYYQKIKQIKSPDIDLVKYTRTDNKFALRRTKLEECEDFQFYQNEISLTNSLQHINLLSFLSSFVHKTELWTLMPFAELGSVSDLSTPNGLSEEAIAWIIKDVLSAVQYLHNNYIIHRSIRGSHVLVFGSPKTTLRSVLSGLKYSISSISSGQVKTRTFDYSKHTENNLNWMSPEILEQNLMGYDFKSDIYSIGLTCCELANGFVPYSQLDPSEILLNKLNGQIPRPIDSSSNDLKGLIEREKCEKPNEIEFLKQIGPQMKAKYEKYKTRKYSEEFVGFTIKCCLHSEPDKRWNATELLGHKFIKQNEKSDKTEVLTKSFQQNCSLF